MATCSCLPHRASHDAGAPVLPGDGLRVPGLPCVPQAPRPPLRLLSPRGARPGKAESDSLGAPVSQPSPQQEGFILPLPSLLDSEGAVGSCWLPCPQSPAQSLPPRRSRIKCWEHGGLERCRGLSKGSRAMEGGLCAHTPIVPVNPTFVS